MDRLLVASTGRDRKARAVDETTVKRELRLNAMHLASRQAEVAPQEGARLAVADSAFPVEPSINSDNSPVE
jgi:hypothetical protein